jgi:predicted permease
VTFHTASEKYFETLGIQLLRGRVFTPQDRKDSLPVVIVNRSLATAQWPGQEALGKRLAIPGMGDDLRTIVGVVKDVKDFGLDTEAGSSIYVPFLQMPAGNRLFLRTASDPAGFTSAVREAVHAIDPDQPVDDVQTLAQVRSDWMAPARLIAVLVGLFAALAFTITALGIGGIVAFAVNERSQELAIRSVLGARRSDIFGLVLRQGMGPVVAGLLLGIGGALSLSRLLTSYLYGVEPADPLTFVAVSVGLLSIVLVACSLPARRAASVDPMETFRR